MKIKTVIIAVFILLCLTSFVYAQGTEQLTITTYYPSPMGVYKVMRLHPGVRPNGTCQQGEMYYDDGASIPANPVGIYVCNASGVWEQTSSFWTRTKPGTQGFIYPTDLTDWVGIGVTTPNAALQVNGAIARVGATLGGTSDQQKTQVNLGVGLPDLSYTSMTDKSYSTVGGGYCNYALSDGVTVSGGVNNRAGEGGETLSATIGGGYNNTIKRVLPNGLAHYSTIAGGIYNTIIGGVSETSSTIGGGDSNTITSGIASTISGGSRNTGGASYFIITGGRRNIATGNYSFIGGGGCDNVAQYGNAAMGTWSAVVGGYRNTANGNYSFVGSGGSDNVNLVGNRAIGNWSAVVGGYRNTADGTYSCIGGGRYNTATTSAGDNYSTIAGGDQNKITVNYSTIAGGVQNTADAPGASIGGGSNNKTSGTTGYTTIGGGSFNSASGNMAVVSGGTYNTATGNYSMVPGGSYNTASGLNSFAAGNRANASHIGSFVWADAQSYQYNSNGDYTFNVRAGGGAYLYGINPASGKSWFDLTEFMDFHEEGFPKEAELVSFIDYDLLGISKKAYDDNLAGVVSSKRTIGLNLGSSDSPKGIKRLPVSLVGRCFVKVCGETGPINIGDPVTSSSIPGTGMKADRSAKIVGYAMQKADFKDDKEIKEILVFVNIGYYVNPQEYQNVLKELKEIKSALKK